MSLFTDLMAETKTAVKGHEHLPSKDRNKFLNEARADITEKYNAMKSEDREQFIAEAKQYINSHNLKAKIGHERFDSGVFVYQTAILAEVQQLAGRADKNTLTPEEKGIVDSPTYKAFQKYTSKLDNHTHPDGLYGKVTHGLNSEAKYQEIFKQVQEVNKKAEAPATVVEKKETKEVVQPAPQKEEKKEVTAPVIVEKKNEPNLVIRHQQDFGNAPGLYTGGGNTRADGTIDPTFKSPTNKLHTITTEVDYEQTLPGRKVDVTLSGGLTSKITNVTGSKDVAVDKLTGYNAGNPVYSPESGTLGKNPTIATGNFLGVNAGAEAGFKLNPESEKTLKAIIGARGQLGFQTTKINTDFLKQSGANLNNAFDGNTLPGSSKTTEFSAGFGGTAGLETHDKFRFTLDADHLTSKSAQSTRLGLNLGKTFNLGTGGVQLGVAAGVHTTGLTYKHNGSINVAGTPPVLDDNGTPTGGTPAHSIMQNNMVDVPNSSLFDSFKPSATVTLKIPLGGGKGK